MEDIMTPIRKSIELISDSKKAYENMISEALTPGLKYIAETYGEELGFIGILGWTPGFNDGEPCEHTEDFMFGYKDLQDYGLECYLDDWFPDEDYEYILDRKVVLNDEIKEFVYNVLSPYYEQKMRTDYFVSIRFENCTYTIEEHEYDCGY